MKNDTKTVWITSELTLSQLLERAKREGELRLVDGDDVFVLKHQNDTLPDAAREFLMRGSSADGD